MATVDSTRTGSPSMYHVKCEVLISQGSKRCSCCKNHRKSLCAMASHDLKDDRTDPSSYANYSCLHTPGWGGCTKRAENLASRLNNCKKNCQLSLNVTASS